MKANMIIKALIQKDKNTFRLLHDYFGYDFEKDFEVLNIAGKFTLNSLEKIVSQAGYIPRLSTITILVESTETWNKGKLYAVILNKAGNNVELLEKFYSYGYRTAIDGYYRKGDFEDDRKRNVNAYIICQKDSDLTNKLLRVYGYRPNYTDHRFDIIENRIQRTYQTNYIHDVDLKVLDNSGYKFKYMPQTRDTKDVNTIIDKSGYIRELKAVELKRKAEQLRRDRAKTAYKGVDNSEKIADLDKRIQEAKNVLLALFKDAKTYDEYKTVSDKFGRWHGFSDIIYSYERLIEREQEKRYSSTQDFDNAYTAIINNITTLIEA